MYVDNATIVQGVFVGQASSHFEALERVFRRSGWVLRHLPRVGDLLRVARTHEISVVFCDAQSRDGTWRDVLRKQQSTVRPNPRLFVIQPPQSPDLWGEVVHAGGWDVFRLPIRAAVVEWMVREASFSWPRMLQRFGRAPMARSATSGTSSRQFAQGGYA